MLQELDVIRGKHCNCYLVKDTIIKWKPFLLAHMSKLTSLLQFWAAAQYCERRKFGVLNVFSFSFIHSFRNQSRFMPGNNLFVFVLSPCLLHLCFLHNIFLVVFPEEKRNLEEEAWKHVSPFTWRSLSPPVYEVLSQISFLSCVQRNSCQLFYLSVLQKVQQQWQWEKRRGVTRDSRRVKCRGRRWCGGAWRDLELTFIIREKWQLMKKLLRCRDGNWAVLNVKMFHKT